MEPHDDSEPRTAIGLYALKHGHAFLVADARGDVTGSSDGLFRDDTRVLSRYALTIGGHAPSLLSSGVSRDNVLFRANLTNRPLPMLGDRVAPEGVIHVERTRFLWEDRLYERLTLTNYGDEDVGVPLTFAFDADFADIFEVRGHRRAKRGATLEPAVAHDHAVLGYRGLDNTDRRTAIAFAPAPATLDGHRARFPLTLPRRERITLHVEIGSEVAVPSADRFRHGVACARRAMRAVQRRGASVGTPSRPFRLWTDRARADIALLTTELPTGPYPFAGIPWFSTPFGRDGIITALELLWLDPSLARGVLRFHAANQSRETSAFSDAAPGKVVHEIRRGEMAMLGEVPFRRYYGGVDTTPLFVMLAGAYARRTGDHVLIDALWPALRQAMAWIDGAGDSNGDGFLDYQAARSTGLANQGWKDSGDSVFHEDGRMPRGPIALVEVQGYVYAARLAMAELAQQRGETDAAQRFRAGAEALRAAVEERFWMPDHGYYALALDGDGKPCRIRTSNAGHLLYTGLPAPERAAVVAEQIASAALDGGWGIRTLAHDAVRFNPMSYHNGSVWPHDTAICAAGLARYGERERCAHVLTELFDAALQFDRRLPELYCGFARRTGEPPVGYPVACLPQAWSSGAVFMVLQACLGITIDAVTSRVRIDRPVLPLDLDHLALRRLDVGGSRVDLMFERVGERVIAFPVGPLPSHLDVQFVADR